MRRLSIDEYKQIVVQVLEKIDRICRDNNLTYTLAYGTLLGAIRHNGFIPWDDDADIVMFRQDYIKLREIINNGDYGIRFIDTTTNYNTIYPFGKVCDIRTHLKEKNFREVDNYGAFVDVFPLDYLPDDEVKRKKLCCKYRRKMIIITHSSRTGYEKSSSPFRNIARFLAFQAGRFFDSSKMIAQMDSAFLEMDKEKTDHVGIPWAWGGYAFERKIFKELTEHEFESHSFYIPNDYDYVLHWRYGNYMQLPPESERVNLHQLECYIDE